MTLFQDATLLVWCHMSSFTPDPCAGWVGGIDLGGTKIEAVLFDSALSRKTLRRRITPRDNYSDLLDALAEEVAWLRSQSGRPDLPVGIGVPGLINRQTGISVTANLPANGHPLAQDLAQKAGGKIVAANDCKCFTLSEANGGAGEGHEHVFGLILGTGLGGGYCLNGQLILGRNDLPGEVGHYGLPAYLVATHQLPLLPCGCGRVGCVETLISGTGIAQIAKTVTGIALSAEQVAADPSEPGNVKTLQIWSELTAELLHTIQLHLDPDCIVLGGGLSNIDEVDIILSKALDRIALPSVRRPAIVKPAFGDSSGSRGAALLAYGLTRKD